jgi:hypothetical protein
MRQEMIFDARERAILEGHACLRSYSGIRRQQLTGLLAALGEYAIRVGPDFIPEGVSNAERIEAHRRLAGFYWEDHRSWDTRASACQPWPVGLQLSTAGDEVFDPGEQKTLALHKYIHGQEGLTKEELLCLLDALGRYSNDALALDVPPHPLDGVTRIAHAHNALIAFSARPFTLDEFADSVRAVLRGEPSRLGRSKSQSPA